MANRIVGLDIGHYSVKAVTVESGFGRFSVVSFHEERVHELVEELDLDNVVDPAEDEAAATPIDVQTAEEIRNEDDLHPLSAGTLEALQRMRDAGVFEADAVVVTHLQDGVYTAQVDLPFAGAKEVQAVLVPQLDGELPEDVHSLLLDFMVVGPAAGEMHRVHAAATRPIRMAGYLGGLESCGIDPRYVDLAPYHLLASAHMLIGETGGSVAVVDIGAKQTDVLIFDGEIVEFARTVTSGGERIVDELTDTFNLDRERARDGMHREAFVQPGANESHSDASTGADGADVSNAVRRAIKPLIRKLRQTLQAHSQGASKAVTAIYVCGGPAVLPGLAEYIGQSLGVETKTFDTDRPEFSDVPDFAAVAPRYLGALGLAMRTIGGNTVTSKFNFRKGPFGFRGSYDFIRSNASQIAFGMAALVAACLLMIAGRIVLLNAESNRLEQALSDVTSEIFGRSITSPEQIQIRLDQAGGGGTRLIPDVGAYHLFVDITDAFGLIASEPDIDLEVNSIEINMQRATFEVDGFADSAETIDALESALGSYACLRDIAREGVERGRDGRFEFGMRGAASCEVEADETDDEESGSNAGGR